MKLLVESSDVLPLVERDGVDRGAGEARRRVGVHHLQADAVVVLPEMLASGGLDQPVDGVIGVLGARLHPPVAEDVPDRADAEHGLQPRERAGPGSIVLAFAVSPLRMVNPSAKLMVK